jgi:hypothetical protein
VTAEPCRPAALAGNEVCLRGWSLGLFEAPEACELMEARFFGFAMPPEKDDGGELAMLTIQLRYGEESDSDGFWRSEGNGR